MIEVVNKLADSDQNEMIFKSAGFLSAFIKSRKDCGFYLAKSNLQTLGVGALFLASKLLSKSSPITLENLYRDACHCKIEKRAIFESEITILQTTQACLL